MNLNFKSAIHFAYQILEVVGVMTASYYAVFFFNQNCCLLRFHLQTEHLSPKPMFANMDAKSQKMEFMISNLPDALISFTHSLL